jgi:peptidyl-prolyl cis-trans isomerase B (cyclophilin B)
MTLRAVVMAVAVLFLPSAAMAQTGTGPIIVVDTTKGTFEVETFQNDTPTTVAHVIALVKSGFYDGQRIHRAVPGFVVQWGDPRSRDLAQQSEWGRGPSAGSGTPVGVAELSRKRPHVKGAVGMAHPGNPALAASQIFVTLADRPELNNKYAVFGHVVSGEDVPARLERGDVITRMYVKE